MPSKTVVSRTYPRTPYAAFDRNGGPLSLDDVLNGIRKDAELVAHYALKEMTEQNLALVTYFDRFKPPGAGYMMGLKPTCRGEEAVQERCLPSGEDVSGAGGDQSTFLGGQG